MGGPGVAPLTVVAWSAGGDGCASAGRGHAGPSRRPVGRWGCARRWSGARGAVSAAGLSVGVRCAVVGGTPGRLVGRSVGWGAPAGWFGAVGLFRRPAGPPVGAPHMIVRWSWLGLGLGAEGCGGGYGYGCGSDGAEGGSVPRAPCPFPWPVSGARVRSGVPGPMSGAGRPVRVLGLGVGGAGCWWRLARPWGGGCLELREHFGLKCSRILEGNRCRALCARMRRGRVRAVRPGPRRGCGAGPPPPGLPARPPPYAARGGACRRPYGPSAAETARRAGEALMRPPAPATAATDVRAADLGHPFLRAARSLLTRAGASRVKGGPQAHRRRRRAAPFTRLAEARHWQRSEWPPRRL